MMMTNKENSKNMSIKKQTVVLIGRCAAGKTRVNKKLIAAGINSVELSIDELKALLAAPIDNGDVFVVWIKAPLAFRIERFLKREGDSLDSRARLIYRIIADGKDFIIRLSSELDNYMRAKRIKYWLSISNAQDTEERLDFIVDYIVEMLKEFL
jgi:dephospho-CoA kinase